MLDKTFILAGKTIFTVAIPETFVAAVQAKYGEEVKSHYTFQVCRKVASADWPAANFVKLLAGPDNLSDYQYVGKLDADTGNVHLTTKSAYTDKTFPVCLIRKVCAALWRDDAASIDAAGFELIPSTRCIRCGRVLTHPESCHDHIGPECRKKHC